MADMKTAMKAREEGKLALNTIRMARAHIRQAEIDDGHADFNDDQVLAVAVIEKFKTAVLDARVVRFRVRLFGIDHVRVAAAAGGQGQSCRQRAAQDHARYLFHYNKTLPFLPPS